MLHRHGRQRVDVGQDFGFRAESLGFRVWGSGFGVRVLGFGGWGFHRHGLQKLDVGCDVVVRALRRGPVESCREANLDSFLETESA